MHVLHITDTHLRSHVGASVRGVDTDLSLRSVLEDAFAQRSAARSSTASQAPAAADYAAILATGDLVQDDPSGYLRFKSLLGAARQPVLCVPGNHDDPFAMRRSLTQSPFQYCGSRAIEDWNFVMLDSCDPGHVGGRLTAAELERMDRALASTPQHALVCLHHHPVSMGSAWLDSIGLANAEEFWRIIDAHAHVRGVAWGHVHQQFEGERKGVRLFATPSTCAQFQPQSVRYTLDSQPPAYRRFDLRSDGNIVSSVCWVTPSASASAPEPKYGAAH